MACLAQDSPAASERGPQKTDSTPVANSQQSDPQTTGSIAGTVTDRSGAVIAGARIKLTRDGQGNLEMVSDATGRFSFADVRPGPFQLTIESRGFATQTSSGVLHPGEHSTLPAVALDVATASTEVQVALSPVEVAEEQIKDQEKQRVLGFIPNFYVSYDPHPAPLNSKQKFKLAWKMTIDPVNFLMVGVIAGVQQAQDSLSGYGQGAEGYAKRYGAGYADMATGTLIGGAILPSLLKQDPRYFYKGSGSARSRTLYAMANAVICKGDNGRWQPNYSAILGNMATGAISNLYYPDSDHRGAGLTAETALIGLGTAAATNLLQEFVIPRFTPSVRKQNAAKQQTGIPSE